MIWPPNFGIWIAKPENGASLPQVFRSASGFLQFLVFYGAVSVPESSVKFFPDRARSAKWRFEKSLDLC